MAAHGRRGDSGFEVTVTGIPAPQAEQPQTCARCSVTISGFGSGRSNTSRRVAGARVRRQRRPAFAAGGGKVIFDDVGLGAPAQRLALAALLPARLPLGCLAQTGRPRRLLQPVARRRLAAVGAVQAEPALQLPDPRLQSRVFRDERRNPSRLRADQRNPLVPRRLVRRFDTHPILESEPESAVRKNFNASPRTPLPNLGSYRLIGSHLSEVRTLNAERRCSPPRSKRSSGRHRGSPYGPRQ